MGEDTTDDSTQHALGRLEGQVGLVLKMLEASSDSRARLHERVDEVSDRLGKIEGDIGISAQIDAQVRERLDAFDTKLSAEVMPTVNEVKRWKITGVTVLAMVGMAGAAVGSFLWWAWDVILQKWSGP